MARPEKVRLGEILLLQKVLTQEQLVLALDEQKHDWRKLGRVRRLGRVLIGMGYVTEEVIAGALAAQLQVPYIDLKHHHIKPEVTLKLPEIHARRFRAILLEDNDRTVKVGMADPTDLNAYDEIARIMQREIEIAVVTESQLMVTIDRVYRRTGEITGLAQELKAELGDAVVDFGALAATPGLEEAPVVKLLQSVFEDATQVRASDIHIEPQEKKLLIRFRIDGVLHLQTEADPKIATALVLRLKLMSGLDISEKRLPQDGRISIKFGDKPIDFRVSTVPSKWGEKICMRLLDKSNTALGLDKMIAHKPTMELVRELVSAPYGIFYVTGPTGSGKTTTLYSALAELNDPDVNISTAEDPIEYDLAGVNQVQCHKEIGLDFARVLRAFLRQDPDIILVGETRDLETAKIAVEAALTGHMVFTTLHTNDAAGTFVRLGEMGIEPFLVTSSTIGIIAHRLARRLCQQCKEPYEADDETLKFMGAPPGEKLTFYKPVGCSACNSGGYKGRCGIYEVMRMTPGIRKGVIGRLSTDDIRDISRKEGMMSLKDYGLWLLKEGHTSVDEVLQCVVVQE